MYKTLLYVPCFCAPKVIKRKLSEAINKEMELGCKHFMIGVGGNFNKLALEYCRYIRDHFYRIRITVVVPDVFAGLEQNIHGEFLYNDVNVVCYNKDEEKQMVEECATFICDYDGESDGMYCRMINYAKDLDRRVENIYPTKAEMKIVDDDVDICDFAKKQWRV